MFACDDTLKHTIYQYPFEDIKAIVIKELKTIKFIRLTLIKYLILVQILDFCIVSNKVYQQQLYEKMCQKEQAKITRIITEFRHNVSILSNNSSFDQYEFIENMMQTCTTNYTNFYKFTAKIISKHYFKILKNKFNQNT